MNLRLVAARVFEEHQTLQRLLDDLARASRVAREGRRDAVAQLRDAIWRLYVAFQDHLQFEERDLAPFLRSVGDDLARKMILEHNEERTVLLTLVEDCESDALATEALTAQADALVARFRSDMLHEEGTLSRLVQKGL
jgi:hemerythrin-like domain-containing protein